MPEDIKQKFDTSSMEEYMQLVAEIMSVRARGERPLAYVRTYGCQQNVADSEKSRVCWPGWGMRSQKRRRMQTL